VIALCTDFASIPSIFGCAADLREALTNLLFNAVDALPQGGTIRVTTRTASGEDGRVRVELTVHDTGIGMPDAVRARLFEPFFTTKGSRGTGLGLSMVRGIISQHGGTIDVVSASGQGTAVTVRLPAAPEAVCPATPPTQLSRPFHSLRVLVIDDMLPIAETVMEILHGLGHDAVMASGGEEGLARLDADRFDVVMTDLGMSGMSGWDVAAAVKARRPGLPVILMTGWAEEVGEERPAGTGVDLVLAKPFTTEQLTRALEQAWVIYKEQDDSHNADHA
jgi:CheY-like chemotaxis protein/anti-sigma regulatory factor (Ser/Thr protein kinase)